MAKKQLTYDHFILNNLYFNYQTFIFLIMSINKNIFKLLNKPLYSTFCTTTQKNSTTNNNINSILTKTDNNDNIDNNIHNTTTITTINTKN